MKVTDYSGTVGTTVGQLMRDNRDRRWVGIYNTSVNTLYVGFLHPTASNRAAVALVPNAYFEINAFNYWNGDIWIVGSAAGTTYVCQEISR